MYLLWSVFGKHALKCLSLLLCPHMLCYLCKPLINLGATIHTSIYFLPSFILFFFFRLAYILVHALVGLFVAYEFLPTSANA